jgi:hypothetical protein
MNVSVLLRLIPAARAGGRLAGQAEVVETGETTVFSDHDEMLAFLRRASAQSADPAAGHAAEPSDGREAQHG